MPKDLQELDCIIVKMSQPQRAEPIFFNASKAVQELARDRKSAEEVFGPLFGWPLYPLTTAEIVDHIPGYAKALVATLENAYAHDVAVSLSQKPLVRRPIRFAYQLSDFVSPNSEKDDIRLGLEAVWTRTAIETEKTIHGSPRPTFFEVLEATDPLILNSPGRVMNFVANELAINITSFTARGEVYLDLLAIKHFEVTGKRPTVAELADLAQNSYVIFGMGASLDEQFLDLFGNRFSKTIFQGQKKNYVYNPDKFEIREKADGKRTVAPKRAEVMALHEEYKNIKPEELITGCPANAELMEAMLNRFATQVRSQAVD